MRQSGSFTEPVDGETIPPSRDVGSTTRRRFLLTSGAAAVLGGCGTVGPGGSSNSAWLDWWLQLVEPKPKPRPAGLPGEMVFEWIHRPEDEHGATIARAPIDGSSPPVELTGRGFRHWGPNPDHAGDRILYYRDAIGHRGGLPQQAWLMDADGAGKELVQERGDHGFRDAGHYDWTIDDRRLVFSAKHPTTKSFAIWVMDVDGSHLEQLTTGDVLEVDPSVCPDGRILFTRRMVDESNPLGLWPQSQEVWIMDHDGGNQQRLTSDEQQGHDPQAEWDAYASPDGKRCVMLRMTSNYHMSPFDNWVMDLDGTGRRLVADGHENGVAYGVARWYDNTRVLGSTGLDVIVYDVDRPAKKTVLLDADAKSGYRQPVRLDR